MNDSKNKSETNVTFSVRNFIRRLDWSVALLPIYLIIIYIIQPAFFSLGNLWALIYYTCLLAPAVLGMHVLILLGLFDLSIGAVAAAAGVIAAKAMGSGISISMSLLLGVAVGVGFGVLSWIFVVWFRISALIATFITLGVARAVSLGITEGQSIGGLPDRFGALALGSINTPMSPAIYFGLILVASFEFLARRQILFRRLYQVGSNPAAAASSGINVNGVKLFGFALAGAGSAIAGLFQCSRTLSASPFLFPNLALECIAACVIGGASLSGGTGRAFGAFLGMLMVIISRNLVVMAGVSVYWQELGVALVLLAAVLLKGGEEKVDTSSTQWR
jgi:ribose transport system permease protein